MVKAARVYIATIVMARLVMFVKSIVVVIAHTYTASPTPFITYWAENMLYRDNGDGSFRNVTKEAGLTDLV
jgi:hypothetical protein